MNAQRKKRTYLIIFILTGISLAVGLSLYALGQDVDLYYTPTQLAVAKISPHRMLRVGGIVQKNSVQFAAQGLQMSFVVTDHKDRVKVEYSGVLPALFREGQGIVVQGKLNSHGVLMADQVLAKHDATYMPPGVAKPTA